MTVKPWKPFAGRFSLLALLILLPLLLAPAFDAGAEPAPQRGDRADGADEKGDKGEEEDKDPMNSGTFAGLQFRGIGPALTSGRIGDLAVDPTDHKTWLVGVASGGVFKTTNGGSTWTPLFDDQPVYSIGCVAIDPNRHDVYWVGTGENNSQRSVGWGDGVYKSMDGGQTWKNMGLEESEHIGKILIDPRDSDVVWVAAQGPLWKAGGDRGLYKTTDGGETWEKVLEISEHTGVSDIVMDPRDPDVVYASAYQRRRHVWTLINGGPESAIHKTTDGGKTWQKLSRGLPRVDLGRIGLALSPIDPDTVYAIVEAAEDEGGFFRSTNAGASWEKRSDYVSNSPQYYQEIFASPHSVDRIYSMNTFLEVSNDGGASFQRVPQDHVHVDHHAFWIDPDDPEHLVTGNDGGVYETYDGGANWRFMANLPITQFYKLALDNSEPFYYVYGGTQDNSTWGGPSRTRNAHGIDNGDWFQVTGGDGFQPRIDPEDPNIVYAQSQYGFLVRFDRQNGETVDIQPQPAPGDEPLKFNWDSPLIISPHSNTRLYFGANRLFRSDDRGNSWTPVSGDLTRGIDRNTLPVMDRVWPIDAVSKNRSTSFYGNLVALSESPQVEGLLYAGTDDGLIQVTEDGGGAWRAEDTFPGVPDRTYVAKLEASRHDADTVYAGFNNHKNGDFKPYLLKSTDRGATWTSIAGDLPEDGPVWALAEDPEDPNLLFVGTEFGVFFTRDGGGKWIQLEGGVPTIAVRDLAVHERDGDLVLATFGRGFYVLDDYAPLRTADRALLEGDAHLFPTPPTEIYLEATPIGGREKGFLGEDFYAAPNPPSGAVFTFYLKEAPKTLEAERKEREKELIDAEDAVPYPSWEDLRAEDREEKAQLLFTITDGQGETIRRLTQPARPGFHRVEWDLRLPSSEPVRLQQSSSGWWTPLAGPLVVPGTYQVEVAMLKEGELTELAGPQSFTVEPSGMATLPPADRAQLLEFQKKTARLQRAVLGASAAAEELQKRIDYAERAILDTPDAGQAMMAELEALETRLEDQLVLLEGDDTVASRSEPVLPSIIGRVQQAVYGGWTTTTEATGTHRQAYEWAAQEFGSVLEELRALDGALDDLEQRLEAMGAPWTPGRVPTWQPEG